MKTAQDLHLFLKGLHPVGEDSVDRIIIGRPETVIRVIGFCWLPYFETIKQAHARGINVLVTHEPTFYNHHDLEGEQKDYHTKGFTGSLPSSRQAYENMIREKANWILAHGMAIIRCHDVLDSLEGIGIPFSFAKLLGFGEEDLLYKRAYYHVYGFAPMTAGQLAAHVARRVRLAGQEAIAFYGDAKRMVSSLAIGTGCFSDPLDMMDLKADAYIAVQDVVRTWVQTAYAIDSGLPLMVLDHGTTEDYGMKMLCDFVQGHTELPCTYLPQGCTFRLISGE